MNLLKTHPELCKQWHPAKNGNLKPENFTFGSHKKVWWKCQRVEDHEWEARIKDRTNGDGCSCCRGFTVVRSNCLATTHPEIAKEWNLNKNGEINPYNTTAGSRKKVWWVCKLRHEWRATIKDRKHGYGCPKCNESKGEKAISMCLQKFNVSYKSQHKFKECVDKSPLSFDFFVMNKFLVEYQGEHHYEALDYGSKTINSVENLKFIKKHDQMKRDWCRNCNIPLLEIPYWEFDKIEEHIARQIAIYCDD